jgi:hypothetical protein
VPRYSSKSKSSFGKAIVLLIGLILVIIFIQLVSTGNLIQQVINVFEQSGAKYSDLVEFSDEERNSIKEKIAGFWTFASDSGSPVNIDDRIEITDNGYIWQVKKIQFTLPSGKNKQLTHAVHAYLHPSSKAVGDTTQVNCILRTFNQVWIDEEDTCEIRKYIYVGDTTTILDYHNKILDIYFDSEKIKLENREYAKYSESDISDFFPPGLIDLVHNLRSAENMSKKKSYSLDPKDSVLVFRKKHLRKGDDFVTAKECKECLTQEDYLRKAIIHDLQSTPVSQRDQSVIISLMKEYYIPACLRPQVSFKLYNQKTATSEISFTFDITWEGETENVQIQMQGTAIDRKFKEIKITHEIDKWKFQPLEKESEPFNISFTDIFE